MFVFQAVVNEGLLHRDLGLGDTWHAPLANGYQIMMIDVTDQGWVYNPKTQPGSAVGEQADAVAGVRNLQVAGRYILGSADSKTFQHLDKDTNQVDTYFLMDTQLGQKNTVPKLWCTASQSTGTGHPTEPAANKQSLFKLPVQLV